jgi:hypothetical protein
MSSPQAPHYAVDFESYYDDEVSIKTLGGYMYLQHPQCDIYLVSIYGPDVDYVGSPDKAPWGKIAGHLWVSHNRAFDQLVYERLIELGTVKAKFQPSEWQCTANMSVYFAAPRDLAGASKALLGESANKEMRNYMKGKTWQEAVEAGKADALCDYARQDAKLCYRLWLKWADKWPDKEQELAQLTIRMGWRGVYVDLPRVEAGIAHLTTLMFDADQQIPWVGQVDAKGKPIKRLSPPQLAMACRELGIPAPSSVAQDSEECEEWLDTYGATCPLVMALRTWRRCNAILQKLLTMRARVQANGRMQYGLKYFGAHTGRWSGDTGYNVQNLPKEEMFGVDLRPCIIPEPGKKFIIADLSQIEPRIEAWIVKDEPFLDLCRKGMSPYEAHARLTMNWTGGKLKDELPKSYALAKARILALGYGAGFLKFITMAKKYDADACFDGEVTEEQTNAFLDWLKMVGNPDWNRKWETADADKRRIFVNSWLIVTDYRASNPAIAGDAGLWSSLERDFKESHVHGVFDMVLPSSRHLFYRQISGRGGQWTAQTQRFGARTHFYGGKLVENLVQASARDVFAEAKLRLDAAGHQIVLSVHDEVVVETELTTPLATIKHIISQDVSWLPGCPIACEAKETYAYCK